MKVLMIAPQPFFQPRGTPFSVLHRIRALAHLGHQVDLLTYPIGQDVEIDGLRIMRSRKILPIRNCPIGPSLVKIPLDMMLSFQAVMRLRRHSYDLLHTHEEAGFLGTFLARRYGILHLYDMHSSLPQQLANFKYPAPRALVRLFERLESLTIRRADAVITICPELSHYVTGKFPGVFHVLIENVADNALLFRPPVRSMNVRREYGIDGSSLILYAGTFEPYQGLDLLIEAGRHVIERMKGVSFLLVGGTPEQVERYRQKADEAGAGAHFIFTGSVPPEAVEEFVKAADVLVSPRIAGTNTPLKIYSYLRSGKPIVATRHITHTQVLNDEVAVLTESQAGDLAAGILKVLEQPNFAKQLTSQAMSLARMRYSYNAYLEKTREVYGYLERQLMRR